MEKWKEVYSEEQIRKVQELERMNLKELDNVCRKIGVEFFAYGGTLIGAVRHKGFIPWDDDLDVAMTRDNYIKFIKEAPRYLPENYYLQTPYTDKKTPYSYVKLRLKGTTCIEYINHRLKIEKGIYVDIYPIDNLPDCDSDFFRQYKEFHHWAVAYAWRQCPYVEQQENTPKVIVKKIVKFCVSAVLKLIPQEFFIKNMDKVAIRYNEIETSRKGNLYYPKPVNFFNRLYPLQDGVFDDQHIKLPWGWEQHLTSRYGDYMTFPPEEKRIGHKPYLLEFGDY